MPDFLKSSFGYVALAGVALLFAVLWRNSGIEAAKREVRTAMEDSIRNARPTVTHREDSTKTQRPPETLSTRGNKPVYSPPTILIEQDTAMRDLCNKTMAENAELKARNQHLELETCTNLITGRGDSIRACYDPPADSFAFKLVYSPDWIHRIHDDTTKTVLAEPMEKSWWLQSDIPISKPFDGWGLKIGFKSVGLGMETIEKTVEAKLSLIQRF